MKPSLGRIVLYTDQDHWGVISVHVGIVTRVHADEVSLWLVPTDVLPVDPYKLRSVQFTESAPGTEAAIECWCWPPRVTE